MLRQDTIERLHPFERRHPIPEGVGRRVGSVIAAGAPPAGRHRRIGGGPDLILPSAKPEADGAPSWVLRSAGDCERIEVGVGRGVIRVTWAADHRVYGQERDEEIRVVASHKCVEDEGSLHFRVHHRRRSRSVAQRDSLAAEVSRSVEHSVHGTKALVNACEDCSHGPKVGDVGRRDHHFGACRAHRTNGFDLTARFIDRTVHRKPGVLVGRPRRAIDQHELGFSIRRQVFGHGEPDSSETAADQVDACRAEPRSPTRVCRKANAVETANPTGCAAKGYLAIAFVAMEQLPFEPRRELLCLGSRTGIGHIQARALYLRIFARKDLASPEQHGLLSFAVAVPRDGLHMAGDHGDAEGIDVHGQRLRKEDETRVVERQAHPMVAEPAMTGDPR